MKPNLQRGEAFEKIAFSFCKIAFFCLLTQKFALPLSALLAAIFFGLAVWNGKNDTDCWAKKPVFIALFWLVVAGVWVAHYFHAF